MLRGREGGRRDETLDKEKELPMGGRSGPGEALKSTRRQIKWKRQGIST